MMAAGRQGGNDRLTEHGVAHRRVSDTAHVFSQLVLPADGSSEEGTAFQYLHLTGWICYLTYREIGFGERVFKK